LLQIAEAMTLSGLYRGLPASFLAILLTLTPFYAFADDPMAEISGLSCQLGTALRTAFPDPAKFSDRSALVEEHLKAYRTTNNSMDFATWGDASAPLYDRLEGVFHDFFGYDGDFAYPAMMNDTASSQSSLMVHLNVLRAKGTYREGKKLKAAGLKGADAVNAYFANFEKRKALDAQAFARIYAATKGRAIEPLIYGAGPTADRMALWLLSQTDRSVSFGALLTQALAFENGDPVAAVGLLGTLFMADSMGRGTSGTVLTDKIVFPKYFAKFKDRGGLNYHFWCYVALAMIKDPASMRVMSWGYEQLLQGDKQESEVDQLAITVANIAMYDMVSYMAPKCTP